MRSATTTRAVSGHRGTLAAVLVALACGGTLAACGSSAPRTSASGAYGAKSSPAALSKCMRANGLSGFPDPVAGPGGVGLPLSVNADGSLTADGQTFAGPALKSAERACREYLPPAGGPPPQMAASQRRRALAFARCMRAHGVPSFPDPSFSGTGRAQLPAAVDPQSPAFRSAARVCGGGGAGNFSIPG
jgi:hypothetical protein